MGGDNSSYYAILSIVGFFFATWCAAKVARVIGISSIVLEMVAGLVLGPQVLKLMPFQYAECFDDQITDCDTWESQDIIAQKGTEYCDVQAYEEADICDLPEYCDNTRRRLAGGASGETKYDSYSQCLQKSCDMELKAHCSKTPDVFTLVGHTGVAMMIFESGMHFDFEKAKIVGPWACVVAVLGTCLPLITGCALVMAFDKPFYPDGIAAGTALAPTSVGIALRLLHEAKQLQSNFGQAIITAAFVDDILSLILFNVLFSAGSGEMSFMGTFFKPLMGVLFMMVAMYLAMDKFPTGLHKLLTRFEGREKFPEKDQALFLVMFIVLIVYAQITHLCGTHLWGCFIAGMSFACYHHAHTVWVKQTKRYTTWMIRIFFAATVSFAIPLDELGNPENIWKGALMGIGPCILSKVFCAFFMGDSKWVIGWAMVGRAEFAYLIAQMAQSANMMEPATFSIVIWSLLWATVWAPFIFRFILGRYSVKLAIAEAKEKGLDIKPEELDLEPEYGKTSSISSVVYEDDEENEKTKLKKLTLALADRDREIDQLRVKIIELENVAEVVPDYANKVDCVPI